MIARPNWLWMGIAYLVAGLLFILFWFLRRLGIIK